MAQTIRRQAKGARKTAKAQGRKGQVRKAKNRTGSLFGRMLAALPFTEEQLHKAFTVLILAGLVGLAIFIASLAGAFTVAQQRFALMAADAGYEVRHVEVRGAERMNEMRVYEHALGLRDLAMPLVDLASLRETIVAEPWVLDARVARQLPDGLVIDIVEREPHAVLARPDRLMLIDPTGEELEPVTRDEAEGMLVIRGPGAQAEVEALSTLLDAAPALRQQVTEAEWIGNRRWNLTFATGQKLALPEGPDKSASALISFARLDGVNRLLGGKVARFDMRTPERIYMQVPGGVQESMDTGEGS